MVKKVAPSEGVSVIEDPTLQKLQKFNAELRKKTHRGEDKPEYWEDPRRIRHPVVPARLTLGDYYALCICLFLAIPLLPLSLILNVLVVPPVCVAWSYAHILPKPTHKLRRTMGLFTAECIAVTAGLPALFILILWPVIVFMVNAFLSLPYIIIRRRFFIVKKSFAILQPWFSFGFWSWHSLFIGIVGAVYRQGLFEFVFQFSHKFLIVPLIKWILIANPFLFELQENYINQWTRSLDGPRQDIVDGATTLVSCALHQKPYRDIIDQHIFACHYPLPDNFTLPTATDKKPKSTTIKYKSTIGIQTPTGTLRRNIVLVTNTETKWHNKDASSRSTLSVWPLYAVRLYWLNPYHHLTGLVEVNLTSQNEIEHPCWCITAKDSFISPTLFDLSDYFFAFGKEAAELVDTVMEDNDVP